jgi:hypothetical protein
MPRNDWERNCASKSTCVLSCSVLLLTLGEDDHGNISFIVHLAVCSDSDSKGSSIFVLGSDSESFNDSYKITLLQ